MKIEKIMRKNADVPEKRNTQIEKLLVKIVSIANKTNEVLFTAAIFKGNSKASSFSYLLCLQSS